MEFILVINSGSSSLKFQLLTMPDEQVLAKGLVERIGQQQGNIRYISRQLELDQQIAVPDHAFALQEVTRHLLDPERGVIKKPEDIGAIGHRVVHGGYMFSDTVVITEQVKAQIRELFSLAPLHNPPNLKGIEVAQKEFPQAVQVAVFDTAFHQTIPERAKRYAIPPEFYEQHHIQVYGFHGTSHQYVARKAAEALGQQDAKLITIHLGNGCSITAVKDGKSVDHSLGFGPVNGLIMGTRSGDIDQSVIFYLIEQLGYTPAQVSALLHHKSGMYGLTGYSDLRDIEAEAEKGNSNCKLALEMNTYRIRKYIGAYIAAMNGVDALVFTAGIGENSSTIREMVTRDLQALGIEIDLAKNQEKSDRIRAIEKDNSRVRIFVIPTNEEIEIARQTYNLLQV